MAVIYTAIIIIQSLLDPYISSLSENIDEIVDKREIRNNYINISILVIINLFIFIKSL
jgi:hypothetical protein